jgi:hypothetical protein
MVGQEVKLPHRLSIEARIKGTERALQSRRTPRWLKPKMRLYLEELRARQRGDLKEAERIRRERKSMNRRRKRRHQTEKMT